MGFLSRFSDVPGCAIGKAVDRSGSTPRSSRAPRTIAMAKGSIRTWEGPEPEEVGDADRDRISDNVKRAFDACGYELQVQEPLDWSGVALRPPDERNK